MRKRFADWLVDAPARRPSGWIGRHRFGGGRGAPRDHEPTFDRVLEWAGPLEGERCLDVGCGGGRLLERVLAAGAARAAGLDHSPDMLALTRRRNHEAVARGVLDLELGDAAALPWPDGTFSVALCANVFFFLDRPQRVLDELFRVLAPGGRLIIATVRGPLPRYTLRQWWVYAWGAAMHVHTDEELRALYERAGFTEIRVESARGAQLSRGARPRADQLQPVFVPQSRHV
jgi:SAM-dependent methyltransferase